MSVVQVHYYLGKKHPFSIRCYKSIFIMPHLKKLYSKKMRLNIINHLFLKPTKHSSVPVLKSIFIHMGLSSPRNSKNELMVLFYSFLLLFGTYPSTTMSLKSIATFNLRKNSLSGLKCHLKEKKQYLFLEKLLLLVLSKNKTLPTRKQKYIYHEFCFGLKDLFIFPEVEASTYHTKSFLKTQGISIRFYTNQVNYIASYSLLSFLGLPIIQMNK